jgi:hypothetical protein
VSDVPSCTDCEHLQGKAQCGRPVPSYWNPATNQRRSRLSVEAHLERSDRKVFGAHRLRCGPQGVFFMPRADWSDAPLPEHDTVGDSDGDDGA